MAKIVELGDDEIKEITDQGEALTGVICMKNWDDEKQCWVGIVCQAFRALDGKEGIVVYDVGTADTQVEIDDWGVNSIATRPWEKET